MNTTTIPIEKLRPFEGHPYKVLDNQEMDTLTESIREKGILNPLLVRPLEGADEFEVISGHRRMHAAQRLGLETVPAFVHAISREEAAILLVDSNLHREHILPSEKAFAYKLKMEAMKQQGRRTDLTSGQVGTKLRTDETMAQDVGDSARQIQRYIRLTHLIPELLQMVDEGKIALSPGVELSYLRPDLQRHLYDVMQAEDCTPSYSQAVTMHKACGNGDHFGYCSLTPQRMEAIMREEKPNQKEKVSFKAEELRRFFPEDYSAEEMTEAILELLEKEHRRRLQRDAR